jgi:hypothetical protein
MKKKYKVLLLAFSCVLQIFAQKSSPCSFEIVDTLPLKKAYFVEYKDSNNKVIVFFIQNKRDLKKIRSLNIEEHNQFEYMFRLTSRVIVNKNYKLQGTTSDHDDATFKYWKTVGSYKYYKIFSPFGFVHWKWSSHDYNDSRGMLYLEYLVDTCIDVYTPVESGISIMKN